MMRDYKRSLLLPTEVMGETEMIANIEAFNAKFELRTESTIGTRFLSRKIQRAFRMRPVRPRPPSAATCCGGGRRGRTGDRRGGKEMGKYCRWGKIVRG